MAQAVHHRAFTEAVALRGDRDESGDDRGLGRTDLGSLSPGARGSDPLRRSGRLAFDTGCVTPAFLNSTSQGDYLARSALVNQNPVRHDHVPQVVVEDVHVQIGIVLDEVCDRSLAVEKRSHQILAHLVT